MWDDALLDNIEVQKPNKHVRLIQIVNKAPLNFKNRDFLDKRVFFKHNGVYYLYITFAPDNVTCFKV